MLLREMLVCLLDEVVARKEQVGLCRVILRFLGNCTTWYLPLSLLYHFGGWTEKDRGYREGC